MFNTDVIPGPLASGGVVLAQARLLKAALRGLVTDKISASQSESQSEVAEALAEVFKVVSVFFSHKIATEMPYDDFISEPNKEGEQGNAYQKSQQLLSQTIKEFQETGLQPNIERILGPLEEKLGYKIPAAY